MSACMADSRNVCAACVVILTGAWRADGQSSVWEGTQDAYWTNKVNWADGVEAYGWGTATFNSAGNNRTNLSLAYTGRAPAMQHLLFTSSSCAPYKIGTSPTGQRYWMMTGGSVTVDAGVVNDQVIGAYVLLGNSDVAHTITFRNFSPVASLTFMGDLRFRTTAAGTVTLRLEGTGEMDFNGHCVTNGKAPCALYNFNSGRVTMAGMNRLNRLYMRYALSEGESHVTLSEGAELFLDYGSSDYSIWHEGTGIIDGAGTLRFGKGTGANFARIYVKTGSALTIRAPITSAGGLEMRSTVSGGGTLVLDGINTMSSNFVNTSIGAVSVAKMGHQGATDSNLGCGTSILFRGAGSGLIYTGAGETSDRLIDFSASARLDQSGTGDLILSQDLVVGANAKTLTLTGSAAGAGELAGVIGPGTGATSLAKEGAGLWRLTAANTYAGATTVRNGTLVLCGENGAAHATSAVVLEGGVLCLSNSVSENVADRLANSAGIALTGGCLAFVHGSGTADYREALGSLTVVENASVVKIIPAAEGQTATLTFASLARSGHGVVGFQGERLGEDGNVCSRILFVTPPALVNGFIGPWATVNGAALAMYDAARGVYAAPASAYIDIAARGPDSVIPDNPALNARIVTDGISGPIALETEDGAGVFSLAQESVTSAIVSMAGKTLTTFAVSIAEEGGPLALGEAPGAGELRNGAGLGEILFDNRSAHPLTVHAALNENGSGTMLTKRGSGTVNLEGRVTVSGVTHVAGGELTWGALADSAHVIGSAVEMAGGRETPVSVRINGASQLAGYGDFTVGMRAGDRCVLRLDGGLAVQTSPEKANGRVYVGNGSGVSGAVIQHSGSFNVSTGISGAAFHVLGNGGGYGYHRIMGGALRSGEIAVGGSSSAGDGNASVLDLFGGEVTLDAWCLLVAWGKGAGAVNLFGGSFGGTNNGGEVLFAYNNNSAITAQVNLLGAGAKMFDRGSAIYKLINLSRGGTNTLGAVNLNAGELTLFRAHASFGNGTPNTTTPTHFNFNGGLLKAAASTTQFMQGLSAAYVRAGGARIDTDGHAVTLNQPLVAPAGYGVSGIALASAGTGYIGAPAVLVSGGAGVGATAIALVDLEPGSPFCGQVTNILVTAAGSGYGAGDLPRVTLRGGGCLTPAVAGPVTLAENISGGLSKHGEGTLTLGGACTFSGGTTIRGGTLKFGRADALLPGSAVSVEAEGTFDLGGFTVTNTVSGGGAVVNGTLHTEFSPGGTPAIDTQIITIGPGAFLEGMYLLDVTADGACDKLTIHGNADVSGLAMHVVDTARLNRKKRYAVAAFSGQTAGVFSLSNLTDDRWNLQTGADGTLWLFFADGMVFMLK
ncbi:MAG: Autotransporter-associated beta strand repeat protein [Verrucomicrobia bacterium ADurb.Bin070]|nr:MAG: Autotransporter-associated beta strand repeat protein [Verrucomicrobia bacterium ADurb.Bin070]